MIDLWITNVTPAQWDAIAPAEGADEEVWHYTYRNAVRVDNRIDLIGSAGQIEALLALLPTATVAGEWRQGDGQPMPDNVPATVIASHPDIIEYDQDANQTGTRTPTIGDQNEAHRFLGQTTRRAARAFSKGFSRGFS